MVDRDPLPQLDTDAEDDAEGLDLERVKELAGFVFRAPRRHPKLAALAFLITAAAGISASVVMPRTYTADVKLLAQNNSLVPALTNPGRMVRDPESPTKNVADQILRTDNLVELAKETNLVEDYYARRSKILKLKDSLLAGSMTDAERLHAIVGTLEKKIFVSTQENNVTIQVDWYDPQMTYALVTTAQKNFLSARYDDDVAMISDAIAVLQEHAKNEAADVDKALAEYQKVADSLAPAPTARALPRPFGGVPRGPRRDPAAPPTAAQPDGPLGGTELATELEQKRSQIRSLEAERQRELDAIRAQLSQAQLTLTPQHPTVIALQQKLDTLSAPDPQLTQLRQEERALMARIAPPAPVPTGSSASPGTARPPSGRIAEAPPPGDVAPAPASPLSLTPLDEDPRAQLARAHLEGAIRRYQEAMTRLDGANIELEIARTAFKYRYTVVTPAEVPKRPKKPVALIVGVSSVLAAAILALLLAAGADWSSGRIVEEWQVRRRLKLPVLGEFEPTPRLPPGPA